MQKICSNETEKRRRELIITSMESQPKYSPEHTLQIELHDGRPMHIFILSGQSNMSGRGGVVNGKWDHVVPPECLPDPSILRFSAVSKWVPAADPLHADIDVKHTCGVGPGMPFANSFLKSTGGAEVVGLVPCAIGGTAIAEWARGGELYTQMLSRAREAAGWGEIRAVLWYQGGSDTGMQSRADAYKASMEKLIGDVRSDLGMPDLPFIQVALASGLDEKLTEQVREAQLSIDMPNVVCVDSKGLPLNSDNLHLTTDSQVVLGKMLADAYVKMTAMKSSAARPDCWIWVFNLVFAVFVLFLLFFMFV